MNLIIEKLKSSIRFHKKKLSDLKIYRHNYEVTLNKKFGKCDSIRKSIKLLIIADTHGTLNENEFVQFLNNKYYDLCVMLGDHFNRDIDIVIRNVDKNKLCGLLGNHDYDYLTDYNIPNINGKVIQINGLSILGMQGSFKYKQVDFPSFTQDESMQFFELKPKVDILVTHDKKFDPDKINRDPAHQGLIGITNYLYQNKIPVHIHGHIHENYEKLMLNGTKEISVFGYKIVEIGGIENV